MSSSSPSRAGARRAPPLDPAGLERLALRYVERFATTRGRLADYLARKLRERGWDENAGTAPDPVALSERFAALGYVDDRGFAGMKGQALSRRGYGARRIAAALHAAHVAPDDAADAIEQARDVALEAALALARRRRIGPFASAPADPATRARQLAAMLRAGHDPGLSRQIVTASPGQSFEDD